MISKRIALSVIVLLSIFGCVNTSSASHTQGMEMFYRWTNDSTYQFTLVFYRNCQGFTAGAPPNVIVAANSVSRNVSNMTFTLTQLPSTGPNVPPLVPPNLYDCWIVGGACSEEYVYRGNWTSPIRANDWIFSYELCCYPVTNAPANVQNGTMRSECGLNNLDFPDQLHQNISGLFHNRRPNHPGYLTDTVFNPPVVSMCEGKNILLDQSVRNYDNDSISYEFFRPQTSGGAPLAYINGFSFMYPMPTNSGPLTINPNSGSMSFVPGSPTGTQIYVLGILATEYRLDTTGPKDTMRAIGFVSRNLTVFLMDSANCPSDTIKFANSTGNPIGQMEIDCPEQPFEIFFSDNFKCLSLDTNGSDFLLRHPASNTIIPIKKAISSTCNGSQTSNAVTLYLDSIVQPDTFELMIKTGNDLNTFLTNCDAEMQAYEDTLRIIFLPSLIGELQGDKLGPNNFNTLIQLECGESSFMVNFSEKVKCSSIAVDGSDFELYNFVNNTTTPVKSAFKNCNTGTLKSVVLFVDPIDPGNYFLRLKTGSDANKVLNPCGLEWPSDSILVVSTGLFPNIGMDTVKCVEDTNFQYFLSPGQFSKYYWSTGQTSSSIFIHIPTTYWVMVENSFGCQELDTMVLSEKYCYTGIDKESISEIEIYPNPASSVLYINSDKDIQVDKINFYNLMGEEIPLILKRNNSSLALELSKVENGVYFLRINEGNEKLVTRKIIVKKNQ